MEMKERKKEREMRAIRKKSDCGLLGVGLCGVVVSRLLLLSGVLMLWTGCTREASSDDDTSSGVTSRVEIPVRQLLSYGSSSSKATLSDESETEIVTADVLVFDSESGTFLYRQSAFVHGEVGSRSRTISTDLLITSSPIDLWVLANARAHLEDFAVGSSKSDVSGMLKFTESDGVTQLGADPVPIPMWGELSGVVVDLEGLSSDESISLLRMVARIDVQIGSTATIPYTLESVSLYNRLPAGYLVPGNGDDPVDYLAYTSSGALYVTRPTLPYVAPVPAEADIPYPVTSGTVLAGTIYAFESPAATGESTRYKDEICIVVGLRFPNEPLDFYRVDLKKGDEFLPILRNTLYKITLGNVTSRGSKTSDDARNATKGELSVVVEDWLPVDVTYED
jgi:hypothetical protein